MHHVVMIISMTFIVFGTSCKSSERASDPASKEPMEQVKTLLEKGPKDSKRYIVMKDGGNSAQIDEFLQLLEVEFKDPSLQFLRIDSRKDRSLASGGWKEAVNRPLDNYRYAILDRMSEPRLVMASRLSFLNPLRVLIEVQVLNPKTFEIDNYTPIFFELDAVETESVENKLNQNVMALNALMSQQEEEVSLASLQADSSLPIRSFVRKAYLVGVGRSLNSILWSDSSPEESSPYVQDDQLSRFLENSLAIYKSL